MEFSTSTPPPLKNTIGFHTGSVKMWESAAILCDADENEEMETQVTEEEEDFFRLRKSVNLLRICSEQLFQDYDSLTFDFRRSIIRPKQLHEDKQSTRANERSLECLNSILQSVAESNFISSLLLAAKGFSGFPRLPHRRKVTSKVFDSNNSPTKFRSPLAQ